MSNRWYTEDPLKVCGDQHTNTTIAYHECLCQFNYTSQKRKMGILKFKHCALADELRKQVDFDMYKIVGFSCLVFVVVAIILFCSFKWYQQTKTNPCSDCCSCLCGCKSKKKKRRYQNEHSSVGSSGPGGHDVQDLSAGFDENWVHDMNVDVGTFHQPTNKGHSNGNASRNSEEYHHPPQNAPRRNTPCMDCCLSEPVQDCCEFFDCDLMWRKKNIYAYPYFGRGKKNQPSEGEQNDVSNIQQGGAPSCAPVTHEPTTLQRRPTRPAPPPPKLPGFPGSAQHNIPIFDDGSLILDEDIICDPIPEAPPSPEPVRKHQPDLPRSIYVDPLAFLQRPFLRLSIALSGKDTSQRDSKAEAGKDEDEPDALYSRVKDFVMSKVRKSSSIASLNRGSGVSCNPDGENCTNSESKSNNKEGKYGKTGSLASLHDIAEAELEKTYSGSKRSMSLASLHMLDNTLQSNVGPSGHSSRNASKQNIADEDVPPNQRDEYIDLEEMARKMAARQQQQQGCNPGNNQSSSRQSPSHSLTSQPLSVHALQQQVTDHPLNQSASGYHSSQTSPSSEGRTPDFIPASAYTQKTATSSSEAVKNVYRSAVPPTYAIGPSELYPSSHSAAQEQGVRTVCGTFAVKPNQNPHQQQQLQHQPPTSSSSAFTNPNFSSFQLEQPTTVHQSNQSTVVPTTSIIKPAMALRTNNVAVVPPSSQSSNYSGIIVPYTGSLATTSAPDMEVSPSPHVYAPSYSSPAVLQGSSNGTLGRQKPSIPPRPSIITDNANYKSLTRPTAVAPSPKVLNPRRDYSPLASLPIGSTTLPHNPILAASPTRHPLIAPPLAPLSLHEQQQYLQQQFLQQQLLQQQSHLHPTMQQLLLQQHLQQEQHTIMTPAVQQQLMQEQQLYQQMMQHQLQQQYQQHLQHQLMQQHMQQMLRTRPPLSSNSSTGSSSMSSKSSRSLHKPNHPPPPPPSGAAVNQSNNQPSTPIESSI